ncbi:MAG: hypothetical protein R2690_08005 [Acidimicrobiales bacterium]
MSDRDLHEVPGDGDGDGGGAGEGAVGGVGRAGGAVGGRSLGEVAELVALASAAVDEVVASVWVR